MKHQERLYRALKSECEAEINEALLTLKTFGKIILLVLTSALLKTIPVSGSEGLIQILTILPL